MGRPLKGGYPRPLTPGTLSPLAVGRLSPLIDEFTSSFEAECGSVSPLNAEWLCPLFGRVLRPLNAE